MNSDPETSIVRGTGNVFADLGYPDADTHLLKAGLVSRLQDVISERKLTQAEAAARMGVSQPDVSRLLKGQFRDMSVERLMRMLTRLGCDIEIVVRQRGRRAKPNDRIHLQAASA